MKIIGLCGGSGSGKGLVSSIFETFGFVHIDADAVYHSLTSKMTPCLAELVSFFGDSILNDDNSLNRARLADIVFSENSSKELHNKLDEITHKYVLEEIREIIKTLPPEKAGAIIDAPMLFESGFDKECDFLVSVIADKNIRIARIIKRDGISEIKAEQRISRQKTDKFLIDNTDFQIINNGDFTELEQQVKAIADKIINLTKEK